MGFKIKKTVNGETVWEPIKAKKYTASKTIEYTGSLPITINADGNAPLDYRIYGADGGVGESTENLINVFATDTTNGFVNNAFLLSSGNLYTPSKSFVSEYFPISENTVYTYFTGGKTGDTQSLCFYDDNKGYISGVAFGNVPIVTFTTPTNARYIRTTVMRVAADQESYRKAMLVLGDTVPTSFVPYGYKLPIAITDKNLLADNISQFGNGFISINGSISQPDTARKEKYSNYVSIVPNTNYAFAMTNGFPGSPSGDFNEQPWRVVAFYGQNKTFISRLPAVPNKALNPNPVTVTSPSDAFFARVSWRSYGSEECPVLVTNRNVYPVYIGENQLDAIGEYRDYVDFGIQKIARKIREYTFTGNETFNLFAQNAYGTCWVNLRLYTTVAYCPIHQTTLRSSHFTAINNSDADFWYGYPQLDDACNFEKEDGYDTVKIFFRSTANFSTAEECKAYFKEQYDNGTPVKILFVMKYTVGQYESTDNGKEDPPVPLPEIPTIDGTTVIDYDGDPKPSQMYIKYNSWSGWSDIDNYKMVNGNWTQEVT